MMRWLTTGRRALAALLFGLAPLLAQAEDPPSVVAWLGDAAGAVSFASAGSDAWANAALNRPLTSGDRLWSDRDSHAEMHVGSTALRLGEQTGVAFTAVSDGRLQVRVSQGTLQLRVRTLFSDQRVQVDTPNLAFVPTRPGNYRIDVSPSNGDTTVTVWDGQGQAHGLSANDQSLRSGEQMVFLGTDLEVYQSDFNPPQDDFDRWVAYRDQREDRSVSARYVSRETMGYQVLDEHGDWVSDPAYGTVWMPRDVAADWAPYQDGRWVWIAPWGWTWVDNARWGFAPFHYGRWAWSRARWVWVPGAIVARPVYAPALVSIVAGGNGRSGGWGVSVSAGAPGTAWLPLGPGEAFRPGYGASTRYLSQLNHDNDRDRRRERDHDRGRDQPLGQFNVNAPHAVTSVSSPAFSAGRPVRLEERRPEARQDGRNDGRPEVRPEGRLEGRDGAWRQVTPRGVSVAPAAPPAPMTLPGNAPGTPFGGRREWPTPMPAPAAAQAPLAPPMPAPRVPTQPERPAQRPVDTPMARPVERPIERPFERPIEPRPVEARPNTPEPPRQHGNERHGFDRPMQAAVPAPMPVPAAIPPVAPQVVPQAAPAPRPAEAAPRREPQREPGREAQREQGARDMGGRQRERDGGR